LKQPTVAQPSVAFFIAFKDKKDCYTTRRLLFSVLIDGMIKTTGRFTDFNHDKENL